MQTLGGGAWRRLRARRRALAQTPEVVTSAGPDEADLAALVGHRFPGGTYRIERWENTLFTEATGVDPLLDGLAHPAMLFHVAINGAGTSITGIFELVGTREGDPVSIDWYDWRLHRPLRQDEPYTVSGGITDVERSVRAGSPTRDSITYEVAIDDDRGDRVADVAWRWHHWRPVEAGS